MYKGTCYGGPLAGERWESRYPKGFLLVDKPGNQCWIYEWDQELQQFRVRDEEPMEVYTEGEKNRFRAAEEFNYDVIAAPRGGDTDGNFGS
jgi:hypothetical protein